jgi:hypothetical protein
MTTEGMRIVNQQAEQDHRAVERQESRERLTDEMREYLRELPREVLFVDVFDTLRERFELTPEQVGRVLAQWIQER